MSYPVGVDDGIRLYSDYMTISKVQNSCNCQQLLATFYSFSHLMTMPSMQIVENNRSLLQSIQNRL